jgi:beta-mannosidase
VVFVAELWQGDRRIAIQTAGFVPIKHLSLVDPLVKADLWSENNQLILELSSNSLVLLLECSLEGSDVVFSDNYFNLPAGRRVAIRCSLPAGWTVEQARQALRLFSVYDSFANVDRN